MALVIALANVPPVYAQSGISASASAPFRQDADRKCNAFTTPSKNLKAYFLTRYSSASNRKASSWMSSDAKRDEALQNSPVFRAGEFVTIIAHKGKIVSATLSSTDASGDGATAVGYCFLIRCAHLRCDFVVAASKLRACIWHTARVTEVFQ